MAWIIILDQYAFKFWLRMDILNMYTVQLITAKKIKVNKSVLCTDDTLNMYIILKIILCLLKQYENRVKLVLRAQVNSCSHNSKETQFYSENKLRREVKLYLPHQNRLNNYIFLMKPSL